MNLLSLHPCSIYFLLKEERNRFLSLGNLEVVVWFLDSGTLSLLSGFKKLVEPVVWVFVITAKPYN